MKGRMDVEFPDRIRAAVMPKSTPAYAVLDRVAEAFGISTDELRGTSKTQDVADARAVAAWILNRRGLSNGVIGRLLGKKDDTTILTAVRRVRRAVKDDPDLEGWLLALQDEKPKLDLEPTCQHGHTESRCHTYAPEAAE